MSLRKLQTLKVIANDHIFQHQKLRFVYMLNNVKNFFTLKKNHLFEHQNVQKNQFHSKSF